MSGAPTQAWRASRSADIRPRPVPPAGRGFFSSRVPGKRSADPGPRSYEDAEAWAPAQQRITPRKGGALRSIRGTRASILDLREIRDRTRGAADLVQELQPV